MRYQYVVILKRDSERVTDLLSIILCVLSAISFLFAAINSLYMEVQTGTYTYFMSAAAVILLGGLVIQIVGNRKGRQSRVRYRHLLILAAIGWLGVTSAPWVGIFLFFVAFLEYQTKRPLEIGFSPDKIVINSLFRKRFQWSAFNNVMLKDGLLTMDFKNNRLLQKEVDEEEEGDADEDEFNDYCRAMLGAASGTTHGGIE